MSRSSEPHHPSQGEREGVVVVEVLRVVDEQLHVGREGAPRLLAHVLARTPLAVDLGERDRVLHVGVVLGLRLVDRVPQPGGRLDGADLLEHALHQPGW